MTWKKHFDDIWNGMTSLLAQTTSIHARERLAAARQAIDDAGCIEQGYEEPDGLGVWRGEVCKRCHRRNVIGFHVPDEVWGAVSKGRWGVLCTTCFDEEAHMLGVQYEMGGVCAVPWWNTLPRG